MAMKTHKATAKRVMITRKGKILKRKAGQDHFNSRESGNVTRNKRTDVKMPKTLQATVKSLLPYHK